MKWQALQLALRCIEFDIYRVAIGSNCVEIHTRFNVNKYITIESHMIHGLELPIQAQDLIKAYQTST